MLEFDFARERREHDARERANEALEAKTLEAQRALREAGRAIQKDVLESISLLNDGKVATEKALADYQLAIIELERLKGTL